MNFKANATFRPGNTEAIEARLVPALTRAIAAAVATVEQEATNLVAVDTGELKSSIGTSTEWADQKVTGTVFANAEHAAYVEFGTGQRGASSAGAGKGITYSATWKGMKAQPYMRPALDMSRTAIIGSLKGIKV